MFVERLELVDFRSYVRADVPMTAGVTTFIGFNGQGKTNLVEAVEYLSTLSSHRVNNDTPLVRLGAHQAVVRGRVRAGAEDSRSLLLEVEINPRRANRARINRAPLTRPREILGVLRTVVFSPNDLVIVRGDPSDRRTFLDGLVMTRWPRMAGVKSDYERVLKQRNALLKSLAGRGPSAGAEIGATMEIWDDELATIGAELLSARLDTLSAVMPLTSAAYREIAPVNDLVTASYKSTIDLNGLWSPPQEGQIPEPIDRRSWRTDSSTPWRNGEPTSSSVASPSSVHNVTTSSCTSGKCRPRGMPPMVNRGHWRWPCGWGPSSCCGTTASSLFSSSTTSSPNLTPLDVDGWRPQSSRLIRSW